MASVDVNRMTEICDALGYGNQHITTFEALSCEYRRLYEGISVPSPHHSAGGSYIHELESARVFLSVND